MGNFMRKIFTYDYASQNEQNVPMLSESKLSLKSRSVPIMIPIVHTAKLIV